jgi:hypothetical protein
MLSGSEIPMLATATSGVRLKFSLDGDSATVPKPRRQRLGASGLHHSRALALTLMRPFRQRGKESVFRHSISCAF